MITTKELYSLFLKYPKVCIDSRKGQTGGLFFALKGEHFDGNDFADDALERGCEYAVVDRNRVKKNNRYIPVEDVLSTLQDLALLHRNTLTIPFVALTGSNGKTTTKELAIRILKKRFRAVANEGNLNNHIGVPVTILSIKPEAEIALIEMGANHKGEISNLCRIARPTHGLITNIGKAHLEGFGSLQGVVEAKKELYDYLIEEKGTIFAHNDNELLKGLLGDYPYLAYGYSENSNPEGEIISADPFLSMSVRFVDDRKMVVRRINSHLIGKFNADNILAAVSIGAFFSIPPEEIVDAVESYVPANNRCQMVKTNRNTLILDAYNANPTSMEQAILSFKNMEGGPKILILGDMAELGATTLQEHEHVMDLLQVPGFTECFTVGPVFRGIAGKYGIRSFANVDEARSWFISHPINNTMILLKGSRINKLEELADVL